ncbi:hypothetical protein [Flavobacterium sp. '19STA2R22 D10 B1']|uniref:hypothetical protein n=1 Tax=Flavobacterium aerium TaxID=3037261 RepID=UPI00278BFE33|nr:hypothetical protein [Flavobacterium sp. '19STA2R22 D10 B1']
MTKKAIASDKKGTSNIRINNTINNTMNKREKALSFLIENSPLEYENFMMRFRKKFDDKKFEKFTEIFDCKFDEEGNEFTTKIISARLTRFALNYISSLDKNNKADQSNSLESIPTYLKKYRNETNNDFITSYSDRRICSWEIKNDRELRT